jgi:hypothetical protein
MPDEKAKALFRRFFDRARAYLAKPGVMAGLELDELTARTRQCALTDLKDPPLGRSLEYLLKAIRHEDRARVQELVDEAAGRVGVHGIDPG